MESIRVTSRGSGYGTADGGDRAEVGAWRKSSYSSGNGGNCVEVGVWRNASYSTGNGGDCVEVAGLPAAGVAVRDSKEPDGPRLAFGADRWRAFTDQVKAGRFDLG